MKTLRSKILVGFVLSITLTMLVLLYLVDNQIKNINIPLTENFSRQIINAKSKEIGTWLYQRVSELKAISGNEDIINMDMNKIKPYINNLNKKFKKEYGNEYESFAISGLDGRAWISENTTINIKNRDYFIKAINTDCEFVISNPIISRTNSDPIVVVICPIYDDKANKVGTIHGAVNLCKLSKIASEITMYDATAWIMDNKGNIFTPLPIQGVEEITSESCSCNEIKKINVFKMPEYGYKGFENVGSKMIKGVADVDTIVDNNGKSNRLIYAPIPYTDGWSLGIVIPEEKLYHDTNRLIHLIIGFGIFLLFISILISILFTSSIVRPIRALQSLMIKVEDGDLNTSFETKGHDEIAQLGNSFNNMVSKIKVLIEKVYKEEKAKRKAELWALQSQIKPHFLYNTLDTIQWKAIEHDAYEAADMILALSNIFRISINKGKEIICLEEEIQHTKNYLFILKKRYQETLEYSIKYNEELNNCKILKLIIQPVVENAVYHGLKSRRGKGLIEITINSEGQDVSIKVKDNGMGIEKKHLEEINQCMLKGLCEKNGYGLYNVNKRIHLEFGIEYGIAINSTYGVGTEVTIKIPKITEGDDNC